MSHYLVVVFKSGFICESLWLVFLADYFRDVEDDLLFQQIRLLSVLDSVVSEDVPVDRNAHLLGHIAQGIDVYLSL